MASRKCDLCGASVKVENLEHHFAKVHPSHNVRSAITVEERRALDRSSKRPVRLASARRPVIAVGIVLLIVAGIGLAWPQLAGPAGMDHGGMFHIHPQVRIVIDGQSVPIPANIGIDPSMWRDHSLDEFSMMSTMAPLHTHDTSGEVHVESMATRDYTIGEFFRVWGKSYDTTQVLGHPASPGHQVWMVVDGAERTPDTSVVFRDGMVIQILCDTR